MDFRNSLSGDTLLGRMLRGKTVQQQLDILPLVSWNMPDTGCLPTPIRHDEWGMEVIYTHPLSTIAAVAKDEVFAKALDLAHESQSQRLYVRGEKNPVDLFDWIKVGVLAETARHGSVKMLEDLIEKLVQRNELTISSLNYETNSDIPCPYSSLAKGSSHYREKLDLLVSYSVDRQTAFWVRPTPSQKKSIENQARENSFTLALNAAMRVGNPDMIDAISQMGPGPLGWAQLTLKGLSGAFLFKKYKALAHAIDLNGPNYPEVDGQMAFQMLSSCAKHAQRCQYQIHGKVLAGIGEDGKPHIGEKIEDAPSEIVAIRKLALFLMGAMNSHPESIFSSPPDFSVHSLFLDLPPDEVDQAWETLDLIGKNHDLMIFPSLQEWMIIDALPPTPWTEKIDQEMSRMSSSQAAKFIFQKNHELVSSWETSVKDNDLDKIPKTFSATERWWSVMREACLPSKDAPSWIDMKADEMPEEVKVYARRHRLNDVSKKTSAPQTRSSGRPMKM